jgi:hypothetical protein
MLRIFICKVRILPKERLWIINHMNGFIKWHNSQIDWWKRKLNVSWYTVTWIAFAKGALLVLVLMLLMGCQPQKIATATAGQAEPVDKSATSGPPNFEGIVGALTCVFAPEHCGKKSEKSTVTAPKLK